MMENKMIKWQSLRADEFCYKVTDGTHDSPKPQSYGHKTDNI